MLLALDIGNTDLVFGVYEHGKRIHHWRTSTLANEPAYHYQSFLHLQLLESGLSGKPFNKAVISSVVPALTAPLATLIERLLGIEPVVVGTGSYPGLRFEIDFPHELGSDLIANAVAAYTRFRKNCIIVDFGTALTVTAVTGDGRLLGVAIVPGLKTAVKALFSTTAQLPEVPLIEPQTVIGKNTSHAIQAGIVFGYEGLVKHLVSKFKSELGDESVVVATGGLAEVISPLKELFTEIDSGLTLDGLRVIAEGIS